MDILEMRGRLGVGVGLKYEGKDGERGSKPWIYMSLTCSRNVISTDGPLRYRIREFQHVEALIAA